MRVIEYKRAGLSLKIRMRMSCIPYSNVMRAALYYYLLRLLSVQKLVSACSMIHVFPNYYTLVQSGEFREKMLVFDSDYH